MFDVVAALGVEWNAVTGLPRQRSRLRACRDHDMLCFDRNVRADQDVRRPRQITC
jgi:hypothetical protein